MNITRRELEVMKAVAYGEIEKEIADHFRISPMTVHAHTRNIRQKTGARTKVDIARLYFTRIRPLQKIARHANR